MRSDHPHGPHGRLGLALAAVVVGLTAAALVSLQTLLPLTTALTDLMGDRY